MDLHDHVDRQHAQEIQSKMPEGDARVGAPNGSAVSDVTAWVAIGSGLHGIVAHHGINRGSLEDEPPAQRREPAKQSRAKEQQA